MIFFVHATDTSAMLPVRRRRLTRHPQAEDAVHFHQTSKTPVTAISGITPASKVV
jgi:hypothetical protein